MDNPRLAHGTWGDRADMTMILISLESLPELSVRHHWSHDMPAVTVVIPMSRRPQQPRALIREVLVHFAMLFMPESQILMNERIRSGVPYLRGIWIQVRSRELFSNAGNCMHKIFEQILIN